MDTDHLPKMAYVAYDGKIMLIEKGTTGYREIPDYSVSPKHKLPGIADRLNKRLGVDPLTKDDQNLMIARSMTGKW